MYPEESSRKVVLGAFRNLLDENRWGINFKISLQKVCRRVFVVALNGYTPYSVNSQNFGFFKVGFWVLVGENRDFRPQIRILREILV